MAKVADKYLVVDPWEVTEDGFSPERGRVSESIFSLGNEYMGIRGYFEEGYSGDSLVGSYLNGVFVEHVDAQPQYRGISNRNCFMVNTVDWLHTRITVDGENLDLAQSSYSGFKRTLNLRNGLLTRDLVWTTLSGKQLKVSFQRALSMSNHKVGIQRIVVEPVNFSGAVDVRVGLDFTLPHESRNENFWDQLNLDVVGEMIAILAKTPTSGHSVLAAARIEANGQLGKRELVKADKLIALNLTVPVVQDVPLSIDRCVLIYVDKDRNANPSLTWTRGVELAGAYCETSFDEVINQNALFWQRVWETADIRIDGDPENQQGIRYCIFQMHQTYHGADPTLNIGAKGLTGESYNGHAFWDTETYCLPFYLFSNPKAARNLLEFRYNTLKQAIERARDLDCRGACYPIATLDGTESCGAWQHASLQFQPSTGVAYGIWHYCNVSRDQVFLRDRGMEMLAQISRFLASRGDWMQRTGEYGFFGVMGPDEFQMMVNNNTYTNYMAKKTFEYTLEVLEYFRVKEPPAYRKLAEKIGLTDDELADWDKMAARMRLPYDENSGVYEQHDGFFDLPHLDVDAIPTKDFPLYHNWSYDRIYRNDMLKQPDVLMFMFLYNREFSLETKRVNYEYYEPRCIHESSLSPSIHSVLATELGRHQEAYDFFKFATRMDLDNYNRNTREGLHTTSIAAAWVNIVYGFGGMRSDGATLEFAPTIPEAWDNYSFRVVYRGSVLQVTVDKSTTSFRVIEGPAVEAAVYGKAYVIADGITLSLPRLRQVPADRRSAGALGV